MIVIPDQFAIMDFNEDAMSDLTTPLGSKLFGTEKQTTVLLTLSLLESSYIRELSKVTSIAPSTLSVYLADLEENGILASRLRGKTREIRINPRFSAYKELKGLLEKMALQRPDIRESISKLRRRARKRGKPLE